MKCAKYWLSKAAFVAWLYVVALTFCSVSCSTTVAPRAANDVVASFDGGVQNSGFIGFTEDGSGVITQHAKDRYNGLIGIYGNKFIPVLVTDEGVNAYTNGTYLIDAEHLVKFGTMNQWRRDGVAPMK